MTNLQKLKGAFARGLGLSESKIINNLEYNTIPTFEVGGQFGEIFTTVTSLEIEE